MHGLTAPRAHPPTHSHTHWDPRHPSSSHLSLSERSGLLNEVLCSCTGQVGLIQVPSWCDFSFFFFFFGVAGGFDTF